MATQTPQTQTRTPWKSVDPTTTSKVRVIVRVRPFLHHEIAAKHCSPISCASLLQQDSDLGHEVSVHLRDSETRRNECYRLDSFFDQDDNNVHQIFYREVSPLIPGLFRGCNATVFAYGATGSGKTYTMQGTNELPGLMPLAMSTVLSVCARTGSSVEISYYEVYMDKCYDLLELKSKEVAVLDDKDRQIHLKGLSRVPVKSLPEFYEAFNCGIQRRKVAHTGLNDVSNRSHGVLVIIVSTCCGDGSEAVVTGKLNLIDLAGNEDNRKTGNEGFRLQESAKINQSLFALSNVIYALNNNKRVPYRESKLTRILQDSLGGTSRALMVACLNPGEYQESVNTVSLAARSRHVSNFVSSAQRQDTPKVVKVDMEAKLQAWLESKGKSKGSQSIGTFGSPFLSKTPGSQSMGAFGSPFFCKTPGSVSSAKRHNNTYLSSVKAKVFPSQGASNAKDRSLIMPTRNLFNYEGTLDSFVEDLCLGKAWDSKDCSDITKDDCSIASNDYDFQFSSFDPQNTCLDKERDTKDTSDVFKDDGSTLVEEETSKNSSFNNVDVAADNDMEDEIKEAYDETSALASKTCLPDMEKAMEVASEMSALVVKTYESGILLDEPLDNEKKIVDVKKELLHTPLRKALSPINSNVYGDQTHLDRSDPETPKIPFVITSSCLKNVDVTADNDMKDKIKVAYETSALPSKTYLPDMEEAMKVAPEMSALVSKHGSDEPLLENEKKAVDVEKELLHTPLRKALSPINSNVNCGPTCLDRFDPQTPKTPFVAVTLTDDDDKYDTTCTPLDKFSARSSRLKTSLVQEYIKFLNAANREELLKLKGIGQKRADYILELRESSPLNSLGDLEKIGLSAKQVHNMFNRAARGILG